MKIHGVGHIPKSHINLADSDVNKKNIGSTANVNQSTTDVNEIRSLAAQSRLSETEIAARKTLLSQIKANVETGSLNTRSAAESVANAILDS